VRLRGVQRYHWARDVDEALSLLSAYQGKGAILAGGVDLARSPRTDIEGLIDITGIGLSYVRKENGLQIGATTTLTEILEHPLAQEYAGGILPETLRKVAYPALRNVATLGGAAVSAHPWADIPTLLVALGAQARWQGSREEKATVEELYGREFRKIFRESVLLELFFPAWDGAFAFEKITRNAGDIALLNVCASLGLKDGKIALGPGGCGRPAHAGRTPPLAGGSSRGRAAQRSPLAKSRRGSESEGGGGERSAGRGLVAKGSGGSFGPAGSRTGYGKSRGKEGLVKIYFELNGKPQYVEVEPGESLLSLLRRLGMKSVKEGCGSGECGSCTVLLEGKPVRSCILFAPKIQGKRVTTLEGLGTLDNPHPLQLAFVEAGAVQCGFCTPGMILTSYALLERNPNPTPDEVREYLVGNLCRCTGYKKIVDAVLLAAEWKREGRW
jgi:aerobic-type carbon monoxide dehydrogenase small subunit (CoxS/CutS family)/CO/xanthine dehydrogenase FAD-binding subunit